MNLQEIKQHAERLLAMVGNCHAAEASIETIRTGEYYDIFGTESERQKDMREAIDLRNRCAETLNAELRIGKILIES